MGRQKLLFIITGLILFLAGYLFSRPLPAVRAVLSVSTPKVNPAVALPWPAYGQGALAAQGYGILAIHGDQKAVPVASVTKVITALAVLKQKPLKAGEQGPVITINSDDVAIYNSYYAQGGSVVKVEAGEQLSEYQALQALLVPSANNIADTLVRWAFGSMENYLAYANKMAVDMGLKDTRVADASGFSPASVSSAQDLVKIGLATTENPVLVSIVGQETVNLPVAGSTNNVNWLLGQDGIIGIKTGNTDAAGGCFLFAANHTISGQSVTLIGALIGAPDLNNVIKDSRELIRASDTGFESVKVATKGQILADYGAPWAASSQVIFANDSSMLVWRGDQVRTSAKLTDIKPPAKAGTDVGVITFSAGQKTTNVPVRLKSDLPGPAWHWRIFR